MYQKILKLKNILKISFSKKLRRLVKINGVCPYCKEINTGEAWCNKCDPGRFLREGKTSGNPEMDQVICKAQQKTQEYGDNIEWIPFERIEDIKPIGEGGFANIYSATWLDGVPEYGHVKKLRSEPCIVALKKVKDSNIGTKALINEIKVRFKCSSCGFQKLYGITKDPETGGFILVMMYSSYGNLRDYLKKNFLTLKWEDKLRILRYIIDTLIDLHVTGYTHRDLHSGNILLYDSNVDNDDDLSEAMISDLGLSQLIYNSSSSTDVCGVLPYIAPEILNRRPYTKASDVYSFGIIMVEMTTGKPPYGSVPHDKDLALAICNGLRPKVIKGTPKRFIDLVNKCLDSDPRKRPPSREILSIIVKWCMEYKSEPEIAKEYFNADAIVSQEYSFIDIKLHPGAIYTSRYMNFPNLSEPRNSIGVQVGNSKDPDLIKRLAGQEDDIERC